MIDVAKALGVSTMTVSRALKSDTSVAPETRTAILKAVAKLGYVPDQTAGSLASRRSGFVAALIPSLNNPHFSETAQALSERLEAGGMQLLLGYTNYDPKKEEALVSTMLRRKPEAMILTNDGHSQQTRLLLRRAGIPTCEIWDLPEDPIGSAVGFSNREAMKQLVVDLARKGYRRVAYLSETDDEGTRGAARRAGYISAVQELGLTLPRICAIARPPVTMSDGSRGLEALLSRWPDSDAVVCVSDPLAFGVITACRERGISVPEQLAVAGFGDFEISRVSIPSITTVSVDAHEIGRLSADVLIRAIKSSRNTRMSRPVTRATQVRIIFRQSA